MSTPEDAVTRQVRSMSRRGFATAGLSLLAGYGAWRWLVGRSEEDGLAWPLRRILELNERLAMASFDPSRRAPEFATSRAREPRVNGVLGMEDRPVGEADDGSGRVLKVTGGAQGLEKTFRLEELRALPRVEQTTELKCIEGWSTVVQWAGVRLADLAATTGLSSTSGQPYDPNRPPSHLFPYVGMATAQDGYYVGLDTPSALHPQTLLCYEMNGAPLSADHGAPVRVVIPVKYGIKNIKWLDRIWFTDRRPPDYWAERGYDWYAGH